MFANDAAVILLAGALLLEQNDEGLVQRCYLPVESMALAPADSPTHTAKRVLPREHTTDVAAKRARRIGLVRGIYPDQAVNEMSRP